ncbi:hypothetical protein COU49_01400 [Candidatus Nomurabacteria bacterium CG10_big_fil_rev_8_21_14_0_10_35_16]|uniref:PrgI family protein n=1 Tax=Candidatus Nomurabacteria bacterium CG10_big_fil_rev_8_21_14_0_10_35_16 TaxID=1974731 RepID=A0A2H0TDK4_9BACT|nr:MAG: hypothetical protein COU49_01400 [Candidatus Nomurabacteria bacterium CG10_big_fil_rev_8_21_14_0_10_35_16]
MQTRIGKFQNKNMRFKVPQFLEIEDKIFGPFTFKEFVYLVGGIGLCFILYRLLGIWIGGIPIIIVASFSLALTFYKPNNKPFINLIESMFLYSFQNKLYIWKRRMEKTTSSNKEAQKQIYQVQSGVRLNNSKLRDLAWSLDVLDLDTRKESLEK